MFILKLLEHMAKFNVLKVCQYRLFMMNYVIVFDQS